jgi:8-oxo-dGTP pyrophosphatase MutT (NUDIX family)
MDNRKKLDFQALICNLIDVYRADFGGITMFGEVMHNRNPLFSTRREMHLHPYRKQGSGASATLMYTDKKTGIPFVLLPVKKNKTQYDQIGGYTRGQGPEGSDVNFDLRTEDEKDRDEEAIIGNKDAVQVKEKTREKSASTTYSLKQLQEAARKEFIKQQSNKLGSKTDLVAMQAALQNENIDFRDDFDAEATARREAREETGIDLKNDKAHEIFSDDDFGISNEDPRLHTRTLHFLFYLGTLEAPPMVTPGPELKELKWVPVTDINLKERIVKNDLPIRLDYVLRTLPKALKKLRHIELEKVAGKKIKYKTLNIPDFADPYSMEACDYHKKLLEIALRLGKRMDEVIQEILPPEMNNSRQFKRQ